MKVISHIAVQLLGYISLPLSLLISPSLTCHSDHVSNNLMLFLPIFHTKQSSIPISFLTSLILHLSTESILNSSLVSHTMSFIFATANAISKQQSFYPSLLPLLSAVHSLINAPMKYSHYMTLQNISSGQVRLRGLRVSNPFGEPSLQQPVKVSVMSDAQM